jgi:Arc/MetJ-type ribon-helix-helix transcriptional regulator
MVSKRNRLISLRLSAQMLAELDDIVLESDEFQYRADAIREAIQRLLDLENYYEILELQTQHNELMYLMSVLPS